MKQRIIILLNQLIVLGRERVNNSKRVFLSNGIPALDISRNIKK